MTQLYLQLIRVDMTRHSPIFRSGFLGVPKMGVLFADSMRCYHNQLQSSIKVDNDLKECGYTLRNPIPGCYVMLIGLIKSQSNMCLVVCAHISMPTVCWFSIWQIPMACLVIHDQGMQSIASFCRASHVRYYQLLKDEASSLK